MPWKKYELPIDDVFFKSDYIFSTPVKKPGESDFSCRLTAKDIYILHKFAEDNNISKDMFVHNTYPYYVIFGLERIEKLRKAGALQFPKKAFKEFIFNNYGIEKF